jgi:hypothetical protein
MDTRLLVSSLVGSLVVVAWYFLLSRGIGIEVSGSEGVGVLWCSGCIPGAPLGRAIKRGGDGDWGLVSGAFGLIGLAVGAAAFGLSMLVGLAPLWAIAFGALSGATGHLLSSRSE